ncbi:MAG: rhomboid family intramembrane serine protease [Neomegalonema sp.]|nr:rhomboid family intramembrane serine protease [Neomegalonema sp.]
MSNPFDHEPPQSSAGGRSGPWDHLAQQPRPVSPLAPHKMTFKGAPITAFLIIAMSAVELASIFSPTLRQELLLSFAITVGEMQAFMTGALPLDQSYRFVTYGALHGQFPGFGQFPVHLLFNMAALAVLGPPVERAFGPIRYLLFFVIATIGGAVGHWGWDAAAAAIDGKSLSIWSQVTLVGASGAIFGVLAGDVYARARAIPHAHPMFHGHLPSPLSYVVRTSIMIVLLNAAISLLAPGISGAAHIGGYLFGLLLAPALMPPLRRAQPH